LPNIRIQNTNLEYRDEDVILFEEGLIGFGRLRRMVLIRQESVEPFLWLAAVDDEQIGFLVIDPHLVVPEIRIDIPKEVRSRIGLLEAEAPSIFAISRITPEWTDSTVNLSSPLALCLARMRGEQFVISDSPYGVHYPLTQGE
jgi:flagellar assembly factor FliW